MSNLFQELGEAMMEPRPLSKERRLYIEQTMELIDGLGPSREPKADEFIRELLAAEQFWREKVTCVDVHRIEELEREVARLKERPTSSGYDGMHPGDLAL